MALRKPRAEITLVEACRVDRGYTIEYVASQTGVSEKTITRYELAQTLKPQGDALEKLGLFYGVRASVLLADMRKFARDRERDDEPTAAAA
jgi:transcriptional regulator with XRE-family HTH domain